MRLAGEQVAALALLAGTLVVGAIAIMRRVRLGPGERERRRRLLIHRTGRMGDGFITDFQDATLFYTYSVRGVEYAASQEVADLRNVLPADPAAIVGWPVTLKYAPRNPANSIVLCEEWSGLHRRGNHAANPGPPAQ
jgi:hypothetical protein